ncbi:MAG: hypothetical protein M0P59_11340 [Gallionella sp.]|jgi:hypothetical protein|nr:hypothetical protein [Gallionella sp.]MCK9354738.1 hypothetical protein [Gallionella sp.]
MKAIFLSASVPVPGRRNYFETADPFLIQFAVRELVIACLGRRHIVWGGHPAITPMIQAACKELGIDFGNAVTLYQSKFFEGRYPEENKDFDNIVYTEAVPGNLARSLLTMREAMISRDDLVAAVFIGGMEGVEIEYELFKLYHHNVPIIPVAATGGAARELATKIGVKDTELDDVDFTNMFYEQLDIDPREDRHLDNATDAPSVGLKP